MAGLRGRGSRRGQVFVAVVVGGGSRRGPCRSSLQVFVAGLRGQVFVVVVVGGGSRSSWTGLRRGPCMSSWAGLRGRGAVVLAGLMK